ncbi:hypothetical protein BDV26DRAFT_42727 [Aspergillus bertholletiae]|uniref:BTB domain-containing protein n=1 Tax=Aspergillus bertholletiae TaxID=1226010 RepID=A0A5N7AX61_9EURO|nr:hypothetical protein BDV26DRAFT_42727 [Aspergillus bertholletiae]
MDGAFGRCIASPLFTFSVGPNQREFTLHSGPLADLSPALHALMNGEMIEAKVRRAEWPDVDEDTFIRLAEYAYLRDYTPPMCSRRSSNTNGYPEKALEDSTEDLINATYQKSKKKGLTRISNGNHDDEPPPSVVETSPPVIAPPAPAPHGGQIVVEEPALGGLELPLRERIIWSRHLCYKFSSINFSLDTHEMAAKAFAPQGNKRTEEDFTPVFLGHARLYVLADKYGIEPLQQLVLHKLKQTLQNFKLCAENVTDIAELVRFTYANTPCLVTRKDQLRTLVTMFIVYSLGRLGDDESFQDLLGEGGDFVVDFWQAVWV